MSRPATEIAILTLKPGRKIEEGQRLSGDGDGDGDGGGDDDRAVFASLRRIIRSQPGFQRLHWGRQMEDVDKLVLVIDWDDISYHRTWMLSPSYNDFLMTVSPLMDLSHIPRIVHINAVPHPPTGPLSAPVTELAFFALPSPRSSDPITAGDADTDDQPGARDGDGDGDGDRTKTALEDKVFDLIQEIVAGRGDGDSKHANDADGTKGKSFATGWVMEELDHPDLDAQPTDTLATKTESESGTGTGTKTGKAVLFAVLLGWSSKEAHMEARQSEAFIKAVEPIRHMTLAPLRGMAMFHVAFVEG